MSGNQGEITFKLPIGSTVSLGRKDPHGERLPTIDLTDVDPGTTMSRMHAELFHDPELGICIRDLSSLNGVSVDGHRMQSGASAQVHQLSRVTMGEVDLVMFEEGEFRATPTRPRTAQGTRTMKTQVQPAVPQWEYYVGVRLSADDLNQSGKMGWELVAIVEESFYFKRRLGIR